MNTQYFDGIEYQEVAPNVWEPVITASTVTHTTVDVVSHASTESMLNQMDTISRASIEYLDDSPAIEFIGGLA